MLGLIYWELFYWAAGVCFFEGKTVVYIGLGTLFIYKLVLGLFLGIVLIPLAIIKRVAGR